MPSPDTLRKRHLRMTKAQLIDQIDSLEQRVAAFEAAHRSGAPMRAKASDRYLDKRKLIDLALFPSENPNPVLRVMPNGAVLYANDAAVAVNGLLKGRKKSTLTRNLAEACAEVSRTAEVQETELESGNRLFAFSITPIAGETYINIYGRNITDRKRAEEVVEKEAQLRVALDNMPGGMMLGDRDLNYVLFNSQYIELFDFPDGLVRVGGSFRDELRYQADRGDFGPGDKDDLVEQVVATYRGGEAVSLERRIAGSGRTLRVNVAPTPEGGYVTIVNDITERKRMEEELAEKEAQLRVALDNMPGGMMLVDRDLNYVVFNSQYSELFEFPDGLVRVGGPRRDALRFQAERGDFGPDDQDSVIEQLIATHRRGDAVRRERTIAGSGRTLQIDVAPTPEGGSVSIYTDITGRKRAEEALRESEEQVRLLLNSTAEAIYGIDLEGNCSFANSSCAEILGYGSAEDLLGEHIHDLIHHTRHDGTPYPAEECLIYQAYVRGEATHVEDEVLWRQNGTSFPVEYRSYPIKRDDRVIGAVVTFLDITERKRMEEELQEAYGIIKGQKERMEKELNIAHDIQMSMVPLTFPPFPERKEFSIYATLEPALEVGGDFYDFFFIDEDRLCFCVGDVSGKGVPAALFMAVTRTMIKSKASADPSTASILTFVNGQISQDNPNYMFVTLWVGVLDIRTGEVTYTNAGHNPPYLKRVDGSLEKLDMLHGPVVGAVEGLVYGEDKLKFSSEDLLLAFTDGVTEEIDVNDELYGNMRLETLLSEMTVVSAERSVQDVVASVREFQGESIQDDDITVLALQFHA